MKIDYQWMIIILFSVLLSACGGDSNNNSPSDEEKIQAGDITAVTGFNYYPKYTHISENASITVSGATVMESIESITVNGVDVETTDNYASWSLPVALTIGDNLITIEVETTTQTFDAIAITSRYQGVVQQASKNLAYDGINDLFFLDYKRNEFIQHNLINNFQSIVRDGVITGLPADMESSILAADEHYIYLGTNKNDNNQIFELYKIDRANNEATLLASNTLPNADVDIYEARDMALSSDGSELIFANGNAEAFISIDTITGIKTLIVDNDSSDVDTVINYISDISFDESNNRLLFVGNDSSYQWGLFKVELSGGDANKFQQLNISSAPECFVPTGDEYSAGLEYNPNDNFYYITMGNDNLYKFNLSTICLTLVKQFDPGPDFGVDSGLQGLAINQQTQDVYLGFFSTTGAYNLDTEENKTLEVQGFSDDPFAISEVDFFAIDDDKQRLFFAEKEKFGMFDLKSSQVTQKLTLAARAEYFQFDKLSKRLYMVLDDFSQLGYIDTTEEPFVYVDFSDSSNNGGFDFKDPRGLAFPGNEFVYLLHHGNIYSVSISSGLASMLSADLTDNIGFDSSGHITFDSKNNRILAADKLNDQLRITSVDAVNGSRKVIYSADSDINNTLGTSDSIEINADKQLLYIVNNHIIYELDLTTKVLSTYIEKSHKDSDLGDLNDIEFSADGSIYMADDDINGFWYINPASNERVILN